MGGTRMSSSSASSVPGYIMVPNMVQRGRPGPLRPVHCRHPTAHPQPSYHRTSAIGCRHRYDNKHHAHRPIHISNGYTHRSIVKRIFAAFPTDIEHFASFKCLQMRAATPLYFSFAVLLFQQRIKGYRRKDFIKALQSYFFHEMKRR